MILCVALRSFSSLYFPLAGQRRRQSKLQLFQSPVETTCFALSTNPPRVPLPQMRLCCASACLFAFCDLAPSLRPRHTSRRQCALPPPPPSFAVSAAATIPVLALSSPRVGGVHCFYGRLRRKGGSACFNAREREREIGAGWPRPLALPQLRRSELCS
jgi:hypothetical protein